MAAPAAAPAFRFGVITDIQYADVPDGKSFLGKPRFYRHALEKTRAAVKAWNAEDSKVDFALNLGDILDGRCKERSEEVTRMLVGELDKLEGAPVYHTLGNHALYHMDRPLVHTLLRFPETVAYYHFSPCAGYRVVVLDSFDVSLLGTKRGTDAHTSAATMLAEARASLSSFEDPELNSPDALEGTNRRWCAFNGAVGEAQLKWLADTLAAAKRDDEKVIVCAHVPLHPGCTSLHGIVWNYVEVLELIQGFKDQVIACLYGHEHEGGYCIDDHGIHHRTFEAVLESALDSNAYAIVDVFPGRIVVNGTGRVATQEWAIPGAPGPATPMPPAPPLKRSVSEEAKDDMVERGEGAVTPPTPRKE